MEANPKKLNFKIDSQIIDIELQPYFYADIQIDKSLPNPNTKTILMVIDKSGSMEGDNIDQSKKVLILLLNFFRNFLPKASINLITFDVKSVLFSDLHLLGLKEAERTINRIEASSSTYFTGVLKKMEEFIKSKNLIEDLSIIFMTDGEIVIKEEKADNFKLINQQIESLSATLTKHTKDCDIHTIGLGKEHDPFFLEKLLNIRPFNSTYLFIIDDTGIEPSFQGVKDTIFLNKIKGALSLFNSKQKKHKLFQVNVSEIEKEEGREWEVFYKMDYDTSEIDLKQSFLSVSVSGSEIQEKFFLSDILKEKIEEEDQIKFRLIRIRHELTKILFVLKQQSKNNDFDIKQLDEFTQNKSEFYEEYHEIFLKIFKIPNTEIKKKLFSFCEDLSPMMNVIDEIISSAYINKIKNDVLAKAIQISHKNIKKKRYIKELRTRIKDSVKLFIQQDEEIAKISQKLSKEKKKLLYEKYSGLVEEFKCFLTCYDFIEAILDKDCLCITFDVKRTSPTSIKVKAIFPTIISGMSFFFAIKNSLNLDFHKNAINKDHIIKGIAQENINAALPVYLCPEHWEISRLLMDRILGWIVTLDPLGYQISQKVSFPFLLMESILKNCYKESTTFYMRYLLIVFDTCVNILIDVEKEKENKFKNELVFQWENLEQDKGERLPENIPKTTVFFLQCLCARVLGWIKPTVNKIEEIYYILIEEELRRKQKKEFVSIADFEKINIFKLEPKEQEEIIEKYTRNYNDLFLKKCKTLMMIKEIMINYIGNLEKFDFKEFKNSKEKELIILKEINLEKNSVFAMFFQNQLHFENAIRKKAFSNKSYVDCRKNWKEIFTNYEENQKNIKEMKIIKNDSDKLNLKRKFRNIEVLDMLKNFSETDNLKEAEELIDKCLVIKPGRPVDYFKNAFNNFDQIPFLYEKLMILKKKHENFDKVTSRYTHFLCYSGDLDELKLKNVFEKKSLPKSLRKKIYG